MTIELNDLALAVLSFFVPAVSCANDDVSSPLCICSKAFWNDEFLAHDGCYECQGMEENVHSQSKSQFFSSHQHSTFVRVPVHASGKTFVFQELIDPPLCSAGHASGLLSWDCP